MNSFFFFSTIQHEIDNVYTSEFETCTLNIDRKIVFYVLRRIWFRGGVIVHTNYRYGFKI